MHPTTLLSFDLRRNMQADGYVPCRASLIDCFKAPEKTLLGNVGDILASLLRAGKLPSRTWFYAFRPALTTDGTDFRLFPPNESSHPIIMFVAGLFMQS
jgi:hypothetical protein